MLMDNLTSPITVSINPTYYCNLNCSFCYLTPAQLKDKQTLDLDTLKIRLDEIYKNRKISTVDLYGGEIQLLPQKYIDSLMSLVSTYNPDQINVITNLTLVTPIVLRDDVMVYVSYDGAARDKFKLTLKNMQELKRPFKVIVLASRAVLDSPLDQLISDLNTCANLISVDVKPYSSNQANDLNILDSEYERFVWEFIQQRHKLNAYLTNIGLIERSLSGATNSFTQDHLYITPSGDYGVLEFDSSNREFFYTFKEYDLYLEWMILELSKITMNETCATCDYFGTCLSEHLRPKHLESNSCSGHRNLLNWYRDKMHSYTNAPWKVKMQAYNQRVTQHEDALDELTKDGFKIRFSYSNVVDDAVQYVVNAPNELPYPAKSYVCGLVYARTIAEHYNVDFKEVLSDPDLFLNDDPHYVSYSVDPNMYDTILNRLNKLPRDWITYPWTKKTQEYCIRECF